MECGEEKVDCSVWIFLYSEDVCWWMIWGGFGCCDVMWCVLVIKVVFFFFGVGCWCFWKVDWNFKVVLMVKESWFRGGCGYLYVNGRFVE